MTQGDVTQSNFLQQCDGFRFNLFRMAPLNQCRHAGIFECGKFWQEVMELEDEFDLTIPDDAAEKLKTVGEAIAELKKEGLLPKETRHRQVKYLNNIVEQDHRFIKRRVKPGLGFFSFETAWNTLQGYESVNSIRKG